MQALGEHVEWMVLPAMHLLHGLNALAQPGVLERHATGLGALLELSPLERAAAMGQQTFLEAKSRSEEVEPGRMEPHTVNAARGWLKQCKELVRSGVHRSLCFTNVQLPAASCGATRPGVERCGSACRR